MNTVAANNVLVYACFVLLRAVFLLSALIFSPIAQLVEYLTVNQVVLGSNPSWGAMS